eukprot:m51a1_g14313 hypothetical protein (145) ;mRNA; r:3-794
MRRAVFQDNFADLTDEEFSSTYLTSTEPEDELPPSPSARPPASGVRVGESLPTEYRSPYVSPIARQQGFCGSCWAFTTCGLVEAAWKKANGVDVTLAPQQVLDCSIGNCSHGGRLSNALTYARQLSLELGGLMAERHYPRRRRA